MRPDRDAYAMFRPMFVAIVAAICGAAVAGGALVVVASARGPLGSAPATRLALVVIAMAAVVAAWRWGGVRAVPSTSGLWVRNVGRSRAVAWEEIVSVRFGRSDPWVRLDLSDGSILPVFAIQRSDGPRAVRQARRLAALVQVWGEAREGSC